MMVTASTWPPIRSPQHHELLFAQLCTTAIRYVAQQGTVDQAEDAWAVERLSAVLNMWTICQTMPVIPTAMIDAIRTTPTTRPDEV